MAEEIKVEDAQAAPKKKGKKLPIILGVVAVVIVAAGAGFFVWHEQPTFCNAICHTPMDAYVETYVDGTYDKYGNEMTEEGKAAMTAYNHGQITDGEVDCLACHVPTLSEQITEGMHWISGSYVIAGTNANGQAVLETRDLSQLTEASGVDDEAFCLKSGCHENADGSVMTRDDLIALTSDYTRNPHVEQHSKVACSECHKAHSQSVNYCSSCHADSPLPDGWLTVAEANKLATLA
ncbi:MAG: cytochrome c3 family protein [Eggerthellales bacterium]|nr:cytochrome c3 family protein [Eggerthellales bacterium]